MNKKANNKIFGMTQTELLILVTMGGLLLCVIFLFGGYILYDLNRPNTVAVLPPTSILPAGSSNTPVPQPMSTTAPTIQPTLLPGPARRYVPVANEGMPANYIYPIIKEYRLDDGDYYQIIFQALDGGTVLLDEPSYFFSAYVGNTVDSAIKKYSETSQSYQVDSNDWKYDWSKNTYASSLFDESGEYTGHMGYFGEVGRVFRVNNVIVLIEVKIRNMNGITISDINRTQRDLDKFTKIVEQKFR
jgi:hypothetical protein